MRRRIGLSRRLFLAWRPTGPRLRSLVRSMATSYLALGIALYILPGRQSSGPLPVLGLVIAVAVVGVVLRPILLGTAVVLGSFGLLIVGVLSQAIILAVALLIAPDITLGSRAEILLVAWGAASIAAIVNWIFDAGSEDTFLAQLLGRSVRVARRHGPATTASGPGLLIIQFDGVGEGLLRQAITAGSVPTLSTWLREGTHTLRGWSTGLPSTTPAGQAVLLHGDITEVPSFRWYEKSTARLMVANHPRDAAEIERRISDGRGLLADGGVSVSNLFSGDAHTRLLTMSDARLPGRSRGLAAFATAHGGLARSVIVFTGQVITELYQGRRQRRRDVRPRVRRGGVFALLRAVTTALLHDLNVALVAEQIARGAPVIFVDFVDYDEVAHHAGPSRPESMRTLDGLDRLLQFFADVIRECDRDFEIVLVSDHGQAQGATFAQLSGMTLHDLVDSLCGDAVPITAGADVDSAPVERWGAANLLLTGAARSERRSARVLARSRTGVGPDAEVTLGGGRMDDSSRLPLPARTAAGLVVAASGSLAHLYLTDVDGRADSADVEDRHPGLIAGLAAHPQVGALMVRAEAHGGLTVIGRSGWRQLQGPRTVGGTGIDPLHVYGAGAAGDLSALARRRHVGDLVLLGRFDPDSGEVVAFEELVGSHGGLGGGQTAAIFVHPAAWSVPPDRPLVGVQVHEVLLAQLRAAGLRPGDLRPGDLRPGDLHSGSLHSGGLRPGDAIAPALRGTTAQPAEQT